MSWYRYAHASLSADVLVELYPIKENRPICVALEGDADDGDPKDGVNAILYMDCEMTTEKNDLFFATRRDAFESLSRQFDLDVGSWIIYEKPLKL